MANQNIRVPFYVVPNAYSIIQAAAARAGLTVPSYCRMAVFEKAQVDESALETGPAPVYKLTQSKRDVLTLLQKQAQEYPDTPYLTTQQLIDISKQSECGIYRATRLLAREGLIERGENIQRAGLAGAPTKTYTISALGRQVLETDSKSAQVAMEELSRTRDKQFNDYMQPLYAASVASIPRPAPTPDETYKPQAHRLLKYAVMAGLRQPHCEEEYQAMLAKHQQACAELDAAVAAGQRTYSDTLGTLATKIESLGGPEAIVLKFNGA